MSADKSSAGRSDNDLSALGSRVGAKGRKPLREAIDLWLRWIERLGVNGTLRPSSVARKRSFAGVFFHWLYEVSEYRVEYVDQLSRLVMNDFLDYMLLDREVSTLTRNNYRTWLVTFFDFLLDKGFARDNVALGLRMMTPGVKHREAFVGAFDELKK